jgi:DeoR family fructose operon transcriptional repressor
MRMSTQERRGRILASIFETGEVTVDGLAASLKTSTSTVRRDLRALAAANCIRLVYGGAQLVARYDISFRAKSVLNVEAKKTVARLASGLVNDGDVIFVDAGTTTLEMAPFLNRKRGITVITHSTQLVHELDEPSLNVILLGGRYRADILEVVGPMTLMAGQQFHGYKAFLGANAVSMDTGASCTDMDSSHVCAMAVRNADSVVLLADSTKFQQRSFCKVAGFEDISKIVTDRPLTKEWVEFLAERKIEVITPESAARSAAARRGR